MNTLKFEGETGRMQRALAAEVHDLVARRTAVMQMLNPVTGEHMLEVGCGGGVYAQEVAKSVGASGRVCAIDVSDDQINAARERCADLPWVECEKMDVLNLRYEDGLFDAVYSVQVLEYVSALDEALHQMSRVLKPGGRMILFATNWDSVTWYSQNPQRMKQVLQVWEQHVPHNNLPTILAPRLRAAGLQPLRQQPVPILNMSYHQNTFSYWIARTIQQFVVERKLISPEEADAWLSEFDQLEQQRAYFFCSTPILTEAIKVK